jgi:flagellar basal-body rod protein FlgG
MEVGSMLRGIYTAVMGMKNSQKKQDTTADNIANSNTTGYKTDRISTKSFPEVMIQNKDKVIFDIPRVQKLGTMPLGVEEGDVYTDFKQGFMNNTGNDLDFAIEGRGFFSIQYPDGVKYTRDGAFNIDIMGRLVRSDGGMVLGRDLETGTIGPVYAAGGKLSANTDGTISIDNEPKYILDIVDFDNFESLEKSGGNMYVPAGANVQPLPADPGATLVKQGSLEQSNVDMTEEMVNMITNLRSYQANQRVIQSMDETLGKAENEVGSLR